MIIGCGLLLGGGKGSGPTITAPGGTITTVGTDTVITYTATGTFIVQGAAPEFTIQYLVVAGGGGGAPNSQNDGGGGGGAGGCLIASNVPVSNGSYAVTVGAGGTTKGNDSQIANISPLAQGGGGGNLMGSGHSGGSGGGGGGFNMANPGGSNVNGQGQVGGGGYWEGGGGGGGGYVGPGANGTWSQGGHAGYGIQHSITGTATYYACGGPGGARPGYSGGNAAPGGAAWDNEGQLNTGNGGGGSTHGSMTRLGGSGIVVIRFKS